MIEGAVIAAREMKQRTVIMWDGLLRVLVFEGFTVRCDPDGII